MQDVKHICALCYTVGMCVDAGNYYICADITGCTTRVIETIFPLSTNKMCKACKWITCKCGKMED